MANNVSVKAQIIACILGILAPLQSNGTVRKISRSRNLTINEATRPAIQIYAGPERLVDKDNRGRTYHFDIGIKALVDDARDPDAALELIVPEIQRLMETHLQLDGLAVIVDGGDEIPFLNEADKPQGGSLVAYTIQYRRMLGDPYTTY